MTREQAEANWIWDPKRGDLRPPEWPKDRRPHCSAENIDDQKCLARPGTLIHTTAETSCPRKLAGTDVSEKTYGQTKVIKSATATHIENVNCLWCRRDYYQRDCKVL